MSKKVGAYQSKKPTVLRGLIWEGLREAMRDKSSVVFYFSRGPVVRGQIIKLDDRYYTALVEREDLTRDFVQLGYLIHVEIVPKETEEQSTA